MDKKELEEGLNFTPRFDEKGLIPCITVEDSTSEILMFAYMNKEALTKTIETSEMHYWSRSRNELWHKGATSGEIQKLVELTTDCDQDALCARVKVMSEPPKACHTGRKSCFYRSVDGRNLKFKD